MSGTENKKRKDELIYGEDISQKALKRRARKVHVKLKTCITREEK